jgi:hypothetical protein
MVACLRDEAVKGGVEHADDLGRLIVTSVPVFLSHRTGTVTWLG